MRAQLQKDRERGFTVLELLVVISIFSLTAGIVLPNVVEITNYLDQSILKKQFESHLRRARVETISSGGIGVLTVEGERYSFGIDYSPFSNPPAADDQLFAADCPGNTSISSDEIIYFNPRGYLVDEDQELTNINVELRKYEDVYCTGAIQAAGTIDFDCES